MKVIVADKISERGVELLRSAGWNIVLTTKETLNAEIADADALVIVTEWDEFRALDLEKIAGSLRGKVLVDLRNVYDRQEAEEAGLTYFGVGRGRLVLA